MPVSRKACLPSTYLGRLGKKSKLLVKLVIMWSKKLSALSHQQRKDLLFSRNSRQTLEPHPAFYSVGTVVLWGEGGGKASGE
jgi:hypothetical protein